MEPIPIRFTPRETVLMRELVNGQGDANKQIAFRMGISERTVKMAFHHLMGKMRLQSRVEVALYVERSGMFKEEVKK